MVFIPVLTVWITLQARGPKKHLKRLAAPSSWMLDKLSGTYVSLRHDRLAPRTAILNARTAFVILRLPDLLPVPTSSESPFPLPSSSETVSSTP